MPRPESPLRLLPALLLFLAPACKDDPPTPASKGEPEIERYPRPTGPTPLDGRRQLLIITTPKWSGKRGKLELWSRADDGPWKRNDVWRVVLGREGLAWGIGLHGEGRPGDRSTFGGSIKTEGDRRTPAGLFEIGSAYGHAARAKTDLDYVAVDEGWRCVDDPASSRYGEIFDAEGARADWTSAEKMRSERGLYRWVITVGHNRERVQGRGSCIFLHVWAGPRSSTLGCAAMPEERMRSLLGWLSPEARPAVAILPESARRLLRPRWGLP